VIWRTLLRGLRALGNPGRADEEADDEIRHFLDESAADLQSRGLSADEARRDARRRWGHPVVIRERVRGSGWEHLIATAAADVRQGARQLRRAPGFAAVAAITLALGVGANTAVLSVFESILLNALPYRDAERLVAVTGTDVTGAARNIYAPNAHEWTLRSRAIASVGLYTDGQWSLTGDGDAEVLRGQRVNGTFFETLGVTPMLGRAITDEDNRSDADLVVLSYELWVSRFGGDPNVVGRTYTLNAAPYRVIGVLGRGFQPFRMSNAAEIPRIYAPLGFNSAHPETCRNACSSPMAVVRLADGASLPQLRSELASTLAALRAARPSDFPPGLDWRAEPLQQRLTAPLRPALWVAIAASACVLLIACANLANLQLARAAGRAGEFAVRGALGASRGRLVRQMLVESLLLAAAGGAGGLLLGRAGLEVLVALAPRELPRLGEISLDLRVLLIAAATGFATALAAGVAPAWLAARADMNDALKRHADRRAGGSRARTTLVVAQVALAFVLMATTGLLVRTVRGLLTVDAGFDATHVLTMTPAFRAKSEAAALTEKQQVVDAVEALPGVTAAGLVNEVPLSHARPFDYAIEGVPAEPAAQTDVFWVEGHYFEAMRIGLREGRLLTRSDDTGAPVAVISETLARRFPGGRAVGRRIQLDGPWLTIVGVVADVRNVGLDVAPDAALYQPVALNPRHYVRLAARTTGDPAALERSIRAAIRRIDPLVPIFHVQPMEDYVMSSMAQRRFALALVTTFGGLALALACIGLYGVLSYAVVLRGRELGVRAALGATAGDLLRLVLARGLLLTAGGLAAGASLAAVTTRMSASLLFGVEPRDPLTFGVAAGMILVMSLAASAVPARRAARLDPLSIIRA
jgi:putative ABC transport system permease protein